jgi:hypothetical protein
MVVRPLARHAVAFQFHNIPDRIAVQARCAWLEESIMMGRQIHCRRFDIVSETEQQAVRVQDQVQHELGTAIPFSAQAASKCTGRAFSVSNVKQVLSMSGKVRREPCSDELNAVRLC